MTLPPCVARASVVSTDIVWETSHAIRVAQQAQGQCGRARVWPRKVAYVSTHDANECGKPRQKGRRAVVTLRRIPTRSFALRSSPRFDRSCWERRLTRGATAPRKQCFSRVHVDLGGTLRARPARMVGGLLLFVALAGAMPAPAIAVLPESDPQQAPLSSATLERVAFAFVDERAKAEGSNGNATESETPSDSSLVTDNASLFRDFFADVDDTSPDEGRPDFARMLGTWRAVDPWEKTLVALQAPKAAIHFDEIMANARAEEETQAAVLSSGAALATRTEARAHAGSLADAEACVGIALVGAALIAAVSVVFWASRRIAHSREELRMRNEALLILASIIKSTESRPWAAELQVMLRNALRDRRSSECIRQLLRRHRELRLRALTPVPGA